MAAEGMDLPPRLEALIAPDSATAAGLVERLHTDAALNARYSKRCLAFAQRRFSDSALDAALRLVLGDAVGAPRAPATLT